MPTRKIMQDAWRLARRAQTVFGGHVRQYIAAAMRQAWTDHKANPVVAEIADVLSGVRRSAARRGMTPYTRSAYYAASW